MKPTRKNLRKKQIKLRKNSLPTLLITLFLWGLLFLLVFFVDPETFGIVLLFFLLFFLATFLTATIVFINKRRGVITALSLTFFLVLMYFGQGNVINLLLVLGITIASEVYFSKI